MKNHFLTRWTLGLLLAGLPWVGGCSQDSTNSPGSPDKSATNAPPAVTNSAAAAPVAVDPDTVRPLVPDKDASKPLPANIPFSPPLTEIVKMAQAGVDDSVMLPFVNNTHSAFDLGSEQIIYLNDLGVPSAVITAMLQHDQSLPATSAPTEVAMSAPPPPPAYAPAYETPPASVTAAPEAPVYVAAPEEAPVVNYNYFYDSLSPYGSWINVDGYGWCWQPTVNVTHSGWRPYCDGGRWLYSNCGWYWQSDYSWGGIAFHYGRWFSHPQWGWCWWPNTTWSPAWVTWRYNNDYCGWAPLPPYAAYTGGVGFTYYGSGVSASFSFGLNAGCYSFVPWQNFCNYRPYRYCVPRTTVNQVYDQSVVVNNFVQGNNNSIYNHGIAVDRVAALSRTDIRRVAVRDRPPVAGGPTSVDRPQRENGQMVVYRSALPAAATDKPASATWTPTTRSGGVRPSAGPGATSGRNGLANRPKPAPTDNNISTFNGRPIQSAYTPAPEADTTPTRDRSTLGEPQTIGSAPSSASAPSAPSSGAITAWASQGNLRPAAGNNYAPNQKAPPGSIIMVGDRNQNGWVREPLRSQNPSPAPASNSGEESVSEVAATPQPMYWQNNRPNGAVNRPSANRTAPVSQTSPMAVAPGQIRPSAPATAQRNDPPVARREVQAAPRVIQQPVSPAPVVLQSAPVVSRPQASEVRPAPAPTPPPAATVTSSRPTSSSTGSSSGKSDQRARSR